MSTENRRTSYIEGIKTDLDIRTDKVADALTMLRHIANAHAFIDDGEDRRVDLPHASSDQLASSVWFDLEDIGGSTLTIDPENPNRELELGAAGMYLGGDHNGTRVATFILIPPNILGYDGSPLTIAEIDGVTHDLECYQAAIKGGGLVDQPGAPFEGSII